MKDQKQYLTKEKYKEYKDELDFLKTTRRKEVAENLEYAKGLGDLSENAEYQEAREVQANVEDRINHLENVLKTATLVDEKHRDSVGVGSKVIIIKDSEKDERTYMIVGSEEADMMSGKISNMSPLGVAIIGKKKGETFKFNSPKGQMSYKIIDIK